MVLSENWKIWQFLNLYGYFHKQKYFSRQKNLNFCVLSVCYENISAKNVEIIFELFQTWPTYFWRARIFKNWFQKFEAIYSSYFSSRSLPRYNVGRRLNAKQFYPKSYNSCRNWQDANMMPKSRRIFSAEFVKGCVTKYLESSYSKTTTS